MRLYRAGAPRMDTDPILEQKLEILLWIQTLLFAANKAASYENVIQQSLDKIRIPMGFSLGHAYLYHPNLNQIESSHIWSFSNKSYYDKLISKNHEHYFISGKELPEKVLREKKSIWLNDLEQVEWFKSTPLTAELGIKTAFAFPIFIEDTISVICEFLHTERLNPDPILIEVTESLSIQLGYILQKHQLILSLQQALTEPGSSIPHTNQIKTIVIDPTENISEPAPEFQGKILVVEDVKANQFVLKRMLEKLGFQTTAVSNGKESCDLLYALREETSCPFDLIFMDCHMSVMNGFEATEHIRKMSTFGANVPIIALTSGLLEKDHEKCLAVGMNDILKKPIRKNEVADILKRWKNNHDR